MYRKGPSIKDVRSQRGGGLSSADKGGGGVFQMQTSALFSTKNPGFFEAYGVSARTWEEEVNIERKFFMDDP